MTDMTQTLDEAVAAAGYYPALASHVLRSALAGEDVRDYYVHSETTFADSEVRRHMSILALTATRLLRIHIDDGVTQGEHASTAAQATAESALLRSINSVALTTVVHEPEKFSDGDTVSELVLAVGWGVHSRIELEPATCGDENCDADHGFSGGMTGDDTLVRVSTLADGPGAVQDLERFARTVQAAVGTAG